MESPCDYGSRHPPCENMNTRNAEEWSVENGSDVYVNCLIEEGFPHAITIAQIRLETGKDIVLQKLIGLIGKYDKCNTEPRLHQYKHVYDELWVTHDIVMRGDRVVLPDSLKADAVGLAHEGHQCTDKTLNLLRQTCWFP